MAYDFSVTSGLAYVKDLTVGTLRGLVGSITNAMVSASAAIASSKLVNRVLAEYRIPDGTTVTATSGDGVPIYTCNKANGATIKSVEVVCPDAPSGGDLTFTVDIQKADASAAAVSVLSSVVTYPNATADYTQRSGTLSTTAIDDGDTLLVQVAVSGATGTQGQGLLVHVDIDEEGS